MPLTREQIAQRIAQELRDGYYVNLGIGMPTLVANHIPQGMEILLDQYGRILTASAGAWADATDTLYQALKTAGLHPVVYRRELPEREKTNGATLPARDATAWDVEKIQIDDIFDVIRSRRFKQPLLRTQREIT